MKATETRPRELTLMLVIPLRKGMGPFALN
jgi:hypothetical protein